MFFKNKNKKNKVKVISGKKKPWREKKATISGCSLGRIFFYLLGIAFLGTVVYFLFFSSYLSITSIEIDGAKKINSDKIKNTVEEKNSGKFLKIIPRNNLLLFSKSRTERDLLDKFNRIETAEVKKIFPEKIKIFIKEKQFQMIFSAGENVYLIDENGSAWLKNNFELEFAEEDALIILKDESAKAIDDPKKALDVDFVHYVLSVRDKIQNETDIEISNNFFSPRLISGDLIVETKNGWKIYFNREIDLAKSIGVLKTVLGDKIKKEDIPNLEYLDLRINNKVYYKLKTVENTKNATENKLGESQIDTKKKKDKE